MQLNNYCVLNHNLDKFRLCLFSNVAINRLLFGRKSKSREEELKKEIVPNPIEEEKFYETQLSDEEIMRIRDKSRLSERLKSWHYGGQVGRFEYLRHYRRSYVRHIYARYGRESGLHPGVMWMTRGELEYVREYEQRYCPTVQQLVERDRVNRQAELDYKTNRERQILSNLKKLPRWKEEFFAKYKKMHDDVESDRLKKERLVQEVREFLGYDVDPQDPRFQEALLKKDEEEKKALKLTKKQERQQWAMAKLTALLEEAKEKEKEEAEFEQKRKEGKVTDKKQQQKQQQSKQNEDSQETK